MIRTTADGVELDVRVIPRAGRTELAGTRQNALLVRLAAAPVDGAANDALVALLASALRVPRGSICIVAGERSRQKRVAVAGVTEAHVRAILTG